MKLELYIVIFQEYNFEIIPFELTNFNCNLVTSVSTWNSI